MQENGEASEPPSRTRSPSPDPRSRRPSKRRKYQQMPRVLKFPDGKLTTSMRYGSLLTQIRKWCPRALYPKQRLWIYSRCHFHFPYFRNPSEIFFCRFFHGCSTFLPVFDSAVDTFASLHERSPFAVDSICMVAARVRDGGGKISCPCRGGNAIKPSSLPQASPARCTQNACKRFRPFHVQLCSPRYCAWRRFKR